MDAMSNFLGRELLGMIEARRKEYLQPLLNGSASDYPDYKHRTGYLKALHDVEIMIESIRTEEDTRLHGAFGPDAIRPQRRSAGSNL
jgi:hypothetical protein